MTARNRAATIVLAAAVALTASGCVGPAPAPSPTATVTVTPTPTPTRTATPSSTPTPTPIPTPPPAAPAEPAMDPADPATWIIDYSGIGPIALDGSLSDVEAVLPDFDSCREGVDLFFDSSIVAAVDGSGSSIGLVLVQKRNDGIPAPHTAEGITIGSTIAEVQSAYPDLVTYQKSFNDQTAYSITDGQTWIHFDPFGTDAIQSIVVWHSDGPVKEYCG